MAAPKDPIRFTEHEWIMKCLEKGPCSPRAIFGKRMPDYLTMRGIEGVLTGLKGDGLLRFGNGKWYRP